MATDAQHYARNYGVSLEEAKRRLLIMANSGPEIEALEQEFKGKIAGIYFDNRGEFKLRVRTVGPDAYPARKMRIAHRRGVGRAPGPDLELPTEFAQGSRVARNAAKDIMIRHYGRIRGLFPQLQSTALNERDGTLEIVVYGQESEAPELTKTGLSLADEIGMPVKVLVKRARAATRSMIAGVALYQGSASPFAPYCTSGLR